MSSALYCQSIALQAFAIGVGNRHSERTAHQLDCTFVGVVGAAVFSLNTIASETAYADITTIQPEIVCVYAVLYCSGNIDCTCVNINMCIAVDTMLLVAGNIESSIAINLDRTFTKQCGLVCTCRTIGKRVGCTILKDKLYALVRRNIYSRTCRIGYVCTVESKVKLVVGINGKRAFGGCTRHNYCTVLGSGCSVNNHILTRTLNRYSTIRPRIYNSHFATINIKVINVNPITIILLRFITVKRLHIKHNAVDSHYRETERIFIICICIRSPCCRKTYTVNIFY